MFAAKPARLRRVSMSENDDSRPAVTVEREPWNLWEAEASALVDDQPSSLEELSEDDEPFLAFDAG
jgi:hypothetical protein